MSAREVIGKYLAAMERGDREAAVAYTVRDGRIAEIRIFEHDQYVVDAYLGGEARGGA